MTESFFFNYSPKNLPFSRKSDGKKEKSVDSFTHEQNIICSQTQLDDIAHEQTINYFWAVICRSRGGLLSNEKEEKFASNDNLFYPDGNLDACSVANIPKVGTGY